ncbi:hypothetical protein Patl1_34429 [Pistacia atlantica]|uniref:Uncharacterized protein n=1 Tax=Pistacia atlantica TaxID=434234 RepID=A0ACC0ZS52_9ROSI|nr:hypothetical protein Patl1_34429 [Pistacia atlantica]
MADYLIEAKDVSNFLAIVGSPISDYNLVPYVMDGLGLEYATFVTSWHLRVSTTFDDLYDLLIHEELFQKKHLSVSTLAVAMAATLSSFGFAGSSNNLFNAHSQCRGNCGCGG